MGTEGAVERSRASRRCRPPSVHNKAGPLSQRTARYCQMVLQGYYTTPARGCRRRAPPRPPPHPSPCARRPRGPPPPPQPPHPPRPPPVLGQADAYPQTDYIMLCTTFSLFPQPPAAEPPGGAPSTQPVARCSSSQPGKAGNGPPSEPLHAAASLNSLSLGWQRNPSCSNPSIHLHASHLPACLPCPPHPSKSVALVRPFSTPLSLFLPRPLTQ